MKTSTLLPLFVLMACVQPSENAETEAATEAVQVTETKRPVWESVRTVDEFGDATGETSIVGVFKGVFDNSATSGSDLTVKIAVQAGDEGKPVLYTKFYEYSREPAADVEYAAQTLKIRLADGSDKNIGNQLPYKDILFDSELTLYNLILSQDKPFKVIERNDRGGTTYKYEIDPAGFKELVTKTDLDKY